MKRNCNGCKASSRGAYDKYTCELGYKMESVFDKNLFCYSHGKPLENCPKPKTNEEFIKLSMTSRIRISD